MIIDINTLQNSGDQKISICHFKIKWLYDFVFNYGRDSILILDNINLFIFIQFGKQELDFSQPIWAWTKTYLHSIFLLFRLTSKVLETFGNLKTKWIKILHKINTLHAYSNLIKTKNNWFFILWQYHLMLNKNNKCKIINKIIKTNLIDLFYDGRVKR